MPTSTQLDAEQVSRLFQALLGRSPEFLRHKRLLYADIDLCPLLRRLHNPSRIILLPRDLGPDDAQKDMADLFIRASSSLTLVLHNSSDATPPNTTGIVYLSPAESQSLASLSHDSPPVRASRFARFLLERLPRSHISPYQTQDPARRRMFYGRQAEMQSLFDQHNYIAILGPRRIGKSSLAEEFLSRLREDRTRYIEVPGDPVPVLPATIIPCLDLNSDSFWDEAYDQIGVTTKDRAEGRRHALTDPAKREYRRLDGYESFLKLTTFYYRGALLILDEIDRLIERDREQGWFFFRRLKGWAGKAGGRLVLLGNRGLFHALRDDDFPFFQTCKPLLLGNFTKTELNSLVREPLGEIGFEVAGGVEDILFEVTGGAPALVQELCNEIVKSHDSARTIEASDVRVAAKKLNSLLVNYASFQAEASGMERLVVLLYVEELRNRVPEIALYEWTEQLVESAEDLVFAIMRKIGPLVQGRTFRTRWLKDALLQEREGIAGISSWDRPLRAALDGLLLRNVVAQHSQYLEYSFVSPYFLARTIAETAGDVLFREKRAALRASLIQ